MAFGDYLFSEVIKTKFQFLQNLDVFFCIKTNKTSTIPISIGYTFLVSAN